MKTKSTFKNTITRVWQVISHAISEAFSFLIIVIPNLVDKLIISRFRSRTQKRIWGVIFLSPWIIGFVLFFLKPFIESFIYSFNEVTPAEGQLLMEFVGFQKYIEAITIDVDFSRVLTETSVQTLVDLPILIIYSLIIAVLLNTKFKGRTFARAVFFIPVLFNSTAYVSAVGGQEVLDQVSDLLFGGFDLSVYLVRLNLQQDIIDFVVGIVNSSYQIISYSGIPILIFLAGIQSVPKSLYEAAKVEGATQYESFWKITLPMVSPLILTATVFFFVDSFLRSPINTNIIAAKDALDYGLSAAMSWLYFGVSGIMLGILLYGTSKWVFYHE